MSSQTQQQQQPVVVYPYSVSLQAPQPPSHYRSNGSFATVFIVVGVIIVASAISCFLGRFFSRRMNQTKPSSKRKHNRNLRPKEGAGGDIEFGPDGRVPSGRLPGGDHPGETNKGFDLKMPGYHGDPREFRVSEHGEPAVEIIMTGNGYHGDPREFRVSEHGEPAAEIRMHGNVYPRMPEDGDYLRFRMPEIGDPIGFRLAGHGGDINGETKPVVADVGGSLKAGT